MATEIVCTPSVSTFAQCESEISTLCRICATGGSSDMCAIFSEEGELWDVVEKIGRCLPIIVLPTDVLPLNICFQCLKKLNTSYELVITAINSEAELKTKFDVTDYSSVKLEVPENDTLEPHVEQEESLDGLNHTASNNTEELQPVELSENVDCNAGVEVISRDSFIIKYDSGEQKTLNIVDQSSTKSESGNKISNTSAIENNSKKRNADSVDGCMETNNHLMPVNVSSLIIYGPATCDLCDVTFADMDEFDNHISEHLKKYKWQCLRCDESFEHSGDLVLHKTVVHGEDPISCERCQGKKVKDENIDAEEMEEEWLMENEMHVDENRICANNNSKENMDLELFYCELCDRNFGNESKLRDHYIIHISRQLICCRCGLKCNSIYDLSVHRKSHTHNSKEKFYTCEVCRKIFPERVLFNIHRRDCGNKHTCNLCDRTFFREYSLQLHMRVHNQEQRQYECHCGEKFDLYSSFRAHKKTHGKQATMKCVTCHKVFTNETFYKRHRYIHDPEFWDCFKCQICLRPFRDAHALDNHMQLHAGIKPHMCDLCGRTYNRFANMLKHRKLHKPQNQWEHNCTHCEAKFERLKDLMSHMEQTHTNEFSAESETKRPALKWICRFCGKRISTKLSLQDHERIHTGAKPYICEWCGHEFRSRPNLLQHHLTHTGDRKHACEVCGKRFARKSFITQHMRVHTGEKPFECDLCGKRFTQSGDMKRHRVRHIQQQKEQVALFVQLQQ